MLDRIFHRLFGDGFEKNWWFEIIARIFTLLLFLVGIFVAVAFLLGGRSLEYEGSVNVAAPPEVIFEQLVLPENRLQWQSDAASIALKTPGKLDVKSEFKLQLKQGSGQVSAIDTVLKIDPGEWFTLRTTAPHLSRVTVLKLRQAVDPETEQRIPGLTNLTFRRTQQLIGLAQIRAGFFPPNLRAQVEAELAKIKEMAETAAGSPASK